ncbi:MAG: translation initiation factor IF-3 [gamma proteobacterium symbiont of Lucinoma myriamae]|nr:translation initiation factor IF-3 [gamma proteobacterium symbiont of Lucinoma myriamae]MCU7818686.1 translation initiation factor IF-3 [gamma proteobacterium symbiont of Lucinoma myriamae]MCU7831172.1 translation initiation factor IF-3 [gamma proteobacterium symbiont of Lucinoma myriamae]
MAIPRKQFDKSNSSKTRINDEITAREIRVIGADGEQAGIMGLAEAKKLANDSEMDLVEIAPTANPPVCRVMDHGKFIFEQKKKKAQEKKKQKQTQVKEVKFRPGTEEGDYQVKLRNLTRFLENGDKTKVTIRFRGREMAHRELGLEVLNRVAVDLEELANVEQRAKLEGRQMTMVLAPKSKK